MLHTKHASDSTAYSKYCTHHFTEYSIFCSNIPCTTLQTMQKLPLNLQSVTCTYCTSLSAKYNVHCSIHSAEYCKYYITTCTHLKNKLVCYVLFCYDTLCYVSLRFVVLWNDVVCFIVLCYVLLCYNSFIFCCFMFHCVLLCKCCVMLHYVYVLLCYDVFYII